jgi:hypothetical protein
MPCQQHTHAGSNTTQEIEREKRYIRNISENDTERNLIGRAGRLEWPPTTTEGENKIKKETPPLTFYFCVGEMETKQKEKLDKNGGVDERKTGSMGFQSRPELVI